MKLEFPKDLAKVVREKWHTMVGGQYTAPDCPETALLVKLLETISLASAAPDEGRYPEFNTIAVRRGRLLTGATKATIWKFDNPRPLTVNELRKLAPATDIKKSAVLVEWDEDVGLCISGLADLGTSWHRARVGLQYAYDYPHSLLVQALRPGSMRIYQGQYHVATLSDGVLRTDTLSLSTFLHEPVNLGLEVLWEDWPEPRVEEPRESHEFAFVALWNVFAGLANTISSRGHGGALIVLPPGVKPEKDLLRVKYQQESRALRDAFTKFMSCRQAHADLLVEHEEAEVSAKPQAALAKSELEVREAFDHLVEAIRFVAKLADCDGALVISSDLQFFGFGAEIVAALRDGASVQEVVDELARKYKPADVEEFGQRHRSALKLVSQRKDIRVLVISQDGPISAVWSDGTSVVIKKGVSLANLNMPWS